MAVDLLRDTFHISRVKSINIFDRLNAQAYRPEVINAIVTIKSYQAWLPLKTILTGRLTQGRTPDYGSSCHKCIKTRHVDSILVDESEPDYVSGEFAQKNKSTAISSGTVVMNRSGAGSIGRTAVYLGEDPLFTNEELFRFEIAEPHDSSFVASFLSTSWGERAIEQGINGATGQLKIGQGHVENLPIITPSPNVQAYIGNKVRQAHALRDNARHLLNSMNAFFLNFYVRKSDSWRGNWRRGQSVLVAERLDSWYYAPEPTALEQCLVESGAHRVGCQVKLVKQCLFDGNLPIQYFEIGGLDISTGCVSPMLFSPEKIPSRAQRSVKSWDILLSTVRPERKNVGLIPDTYDGQLVASTGFAVLRADSADLAGFLWGYLRSDAATVQLLRWNTGAAYPAIDDEVPLSIYIPDYPHEEMETYGAQWRRTPVLLFYSRQLTTTARLLTEALIEKKITEEELIEAYKDPAKDRELLSRLTAKGIDTPDEPPLFPDLDALFDLLAEKDNQEVA